MEADIDLEEIDEFLDHQSKKEKQSNIDLCYRMKNRTENYTIREDEGKLVCPLCNLSVKNVHLHFERKRDCGQQIDMVHFSHEYERYKRDKDRKRIRQNVRRCELKQKQADPKGYNKRKTEATKKYQNKKKQEDPTGFNKRNLEAAKKSQNKKKQQDPTGFNKRHAESAKRYEEKRKTNTDDRERIFNFKAATLFGPIFICSCCKRRLFQHSVTKITDELITKIDGKVPGLYKKCIEMEDIIQPMKIFVVHRRRGNIANSNL